MPAQKSEAEESISHLMLRSSKVFGLRYDAQIRSLFYTFLAERSYSSASPAMERGNGNPSERSKSHYLTSRENQERKYDP